jgi:hypothetical protein
VKLPDWVQWQRLYDTPEQVVAQRLLIVQRMIREFVASRECDAVKIVSVCVVFGNILDNDVHRTIDALPQFCARGATVIWTRHRGPPDLTPTIRGWFADAGFAELGFESTGAEAPRPGAFPAQFIGAHRWPRDPVPLELGKRLFTFFR